MIFLGGIREVRSTHDSPRDLWLEEDNTDLVLTIHSPASDLKYGIRLTYDQVLELNRHTATYLADAKKYAGIH